MAKPWEYRGLALNPSKMPYEWCRGHASPCCFFPQDFVRYNNRFIVGLVNGREPTQIVDKQKIYGKFRPGLILYDPKNGKIPWVSPKPLFEDPDATTITFASDFFVIEICDDLNNNFLQISNR